MTHRTRTYAIVAAAAFALSAAVTFPARAAFSDNDVSQQGFHERLAPYGHWFQHPRWGEVWHPTEVPADFRPYRDGHWENTADYGTVWVSDYSAAADERGRWGDIVFHYGRWVNDPQSGWLWVPGYTWSPAWVVWRQGGGNVGWFPMPPGAYDGVGDYPDDWAGWYGYRGWYGPALTDAAFFAMWSFVPAYDIYAPEIGVDVIAPGAYGGFIGRTAAWTRFDVVDGHLANRAIDGARFHAAFGRELPASARHEFLLHHGPIIGLDRSRRLEMAHGSMRATYSSRAYTATHHGALYGTEHSAMHGTYSHGETHYTHPGYTHTPSGYAHTPSGYTHTNNGGYTQHEVNGGYGQHPTNGMSGYSQHPTNSMGGHAQHPTSGGSLGGTAQHPQTQQPANNRQHPH